MSEEKAPLLTGTGRIAWKLTGAVASDVARHATQAILAALNRRDQVPEAVFGAEGRHDVHVLIASSLPVRWVAERRVVGGQPWGLCVLINNTPCPLPRLQRVVSGLVAAVTATTGGVRHRGAVVVDRQPARVVRELPVAVPRHGLPMHQICATMKAVPLRLAVSGGEPAAV
jgi:hypothetical protein